MESKYLYKCDDCGHQWRSDEYDAEDDKECDYESGAECPKCESENVGGTEIK